jgi:DNA-binding NtrC family response regulator
MDMSTSSILIVDDEEELATLYRQYLLGMGFNAVSFTNPSLAFEHYKQCPDKYSVIMTDQRMPCMSGIELANKIRDFNSTVKILLMTAFDIADIEHHQDYRTANFDRLLQKPIKLSMLKEIIEQNIVVHNR